jgi:hypothetical protein
VAATRGLPAYVSCSSTESLPASGSAKDGADGSSYASGCRAASEDQAEPHSSVKRSGSVPSSGSNLNSPSIRLDRLIHKTVV